MFGEISPAPDLPGADAKKSEQHRRRARDYAVPGFDYIKRAAKLVGPSLHRVDKSPQMLLCRAFDLGGGIALVLQFPAKSLYGVSCAGSSHVEGPPK